MIKAAELKEERVLRMLRWAVATIINPHIKKNIDPKDLIKLPSDEAKVVVDDSRMERMKAIHAKWDEKMKNKNNGKL